MKFRILFINLTLILLASHSLTARALDLKGIHIGDGVAVIQQQIAGITCTVSKKSNAQLCSGNTTYANHPATVTVFTENGAVFIVRVEFDAFYFSEVSALLIDKFGAPSTGVAGLLQTWTRDGVDLSIVNEAAGSDNKSTASTDKIDTNHFASVMLMADHLPSAPPEKAQ